MYLGVAVVIAFVISFPFSIYASLLVLFLLNMIRSRVVLRRSNESILKVLQKWLTSVGNNSKVAIDRRLAYSNEILLCAMWQ
jgi:hypothetical protein